MRFPRVPLLLVLALTGLAGPSSAQDSPLLLELAGGIALPGGSFTDGSAPGEGTDAGGAFGVGFTLKRSDRIAFYLGFDQQRFGCESAGCADSGTYVATCFDLGLRFALLTGDTVVPWLRLAAITTRVETGDLPDPNAGVSELGWGGEAAFGVFVGTDWIGLNPTVSYAVVDTDLPGGDTLGLRYLTAYVGVTFPF